MKLAVVQLLPAGRSDEDRARSLALIGRACAAGAEVVVLPRVPSLLGEEPLAMPEECGAGVALLDGMELPAGRPPLSHTPLGLVAELQGDDALDPDLHQPLRDAKPSAIVLRAEPESPLQAEAVLELAVAYSTSIAGLVVTAACSALDESGDAYGGSAIVQHGEIVAEAFEPDEILFAEVEPPVVLQEPVAPLPELQLILRQRLSHHRGGKAEVGYLADLD